MFDDVGEAVKTQVSKGGEKARPKRKLGAGFEDEEEDEEREEVRKEVRKEVQEEVQEEREEEEEEEEEEYDAFDLVKETNDKGVTQYIRIGDVYYVNADTLDVACDEERVEWYNAALQGKADFEEIDDEEGEGEYPVHMWYNMHTIWYHYIVYCTMD